VPIRYLNTDLDVLAAGDLAPLAAALAAERVLALHVTRGGDGLWRATFETADQYTEPADTIAALLTAIEALPAPAAADWRACTLRELNIGYDCGRMPHAFNQGLPNPLLRHMADAGVSLRITLYPGSA
jgi:hypothetical protein